jgi:N-succinyldiaminopimelate aminotransferase
VNPNLARLQSYPFEKLRALFAGIEPPAHLKPVRLSIGEPQHPTPGFIRQTLADNLGGLSSYPATLGSDALRGAIAHWLERRYGLPKIDPASQVIPVAGTREALFAFAQCVVDGSRPAAKVLCPNPFYQIYEGAALLANAEPIFINNLPENDFGSDFGAIDEATWQRHAIALCVLAGQPNRQGTVETAELEDVLFDLSDRTAS